MGRFSKQQIKVGILELGYLVITIVFLVLLNSLNKTLLANHYDDNAIELLLHNNGQPIRYFVFTLVLFLAGIAWCWYLGRAISSRYYDYLDIVVMGTSIALTAIKLFLLIIFINNPILKAVMFVSFGGAACAYSVTNKN